MESTKTFVENPSGKLAVTVHAPRSLREEEAAYFHGINLEQAHKFAHLNGWQLTVDQEKDDTVSAADADSFKIGDATIDGVGGKGQQAMCMQYSFRLEKFIFQLNQRQTITGLNGD